MSRPPCLFSGSFVFSSCPCVLSSCLHSFVIQFTPLEVNSIHPYCRSVFLFFTFFFFFLVFLCFAAIAMSACVHSHWTLVLSPSLSCTCARGSYYVYIHNMCCIFVFGWVFFACTCALSPSYLCTCFALLATLGNYTMSC